MSSDSDTAEPAEDESRDQGIAMGDLREDLEDFDYPATTAPLVDEFGDREIDLPDGSTTFGEVMGDIEGDGQEYQDAEDVQSMVKNMVGGEAVGREGYSDRGGAVNETDGDGDQGIDEGEGGDESL